MQSKTTTKIIIDKLKLDILFRFNVDAEIIVKRIKGEDVSTSDPVINDLLDSLIDVKTFDNWGGQREGAGRKSQKTAKNNQDDNQLENQDENQVANQDANQVVDTDRDNIYINNNINNISTTREEKNQIDNQVEKKEKFHNALEIFGNAYKATDAVVGIFERPDGTKREGIQIKNPHLMAFVKHRFDKKTLEKVSDWAIDHNQRGHTYNASSLIKLLCKFQSNLEPTINFNHVQSEYLTFEQQR